jgi:hypothetical protein
VSVYDYATALASHANAVQAGDSIHQGPTQGGERESTDKQKRIVKTILVVTAIVLLFVSLAWLGAD